MSLEQALNENTAAIKALGLIMAGLTPSTGAQIAAASEPAVTKSTTKTEKPEVSKAEKPADTPPAVAEAKAVTYDEAKAAVTAVVKAKGRDGGLAVLSKFNTQSLLEVPEAQWADVIAACNEALK